MGSRGETKLVLREALRGLVPEEILSRKDKIGFATPEKAWLEALSPWVESVLGSEFALGSPWLNEVVLRTEWEQLKAGKKAFHFQFWRALNLLKWCEAKGIQA
jgi:asparagine synthase (glutamine-hydrolysing)